MGPVIHVLLQGETLAAGAPAAHEAHGVEVEQQGGGAALGGGFGVEYVGLAPGHLHALQARGVLVEQVAKVGGRLVGDSDGQEHGAGGARGRRGAQQRRRQATPGYIFALPRRIPTAARACTYPLGIAAGAPSALPGTPARLCELRGSLCSQTNR